MKTVDETIKHLQQQGEDSQFIFVANPTIIEDVIYIDGRKVDNLLIHIRQGAYLVLPQIVYYTSMLDDDSMDFISTVSVAKNLIGYNSEDIHLVVDRKIPEDHGLSDIVLPNQITNMNQYVETLKDMDYVKRCEDFFGGQIIELE
ncbi:MAG: hypothetical protein N4A71_14860 [Carboxylicivirga sp.]|jgi:hypothetical protein|nr:hypothetical protein [Carboxylicivirga sp.]